MTWTVSAYRRSGGAEIHEYTSHRLASPGLVREHMRLAGERPWVSRLVLTEHVREVARRGIGEQDLPVRGELTRRVPVSAGGRLVAHFYEIEGLENAGPLSADDVRFHLHWLRAVSPGTAWPLDGTGPGGRAIALWEVTVVDRARPSSEDALPHTPHDP
ncbi:hypothetical protein AB0393_28395 [Streptomyces cyaneofuscatus]|uniref:hypothetical protein n=1 Tax=Streptomyces cyaneofuscatus TaxID=66883 RepID=UPI00344E896B